MIDLRPFCSSDAYRYYLHKPFSLGEHTYASNGLIMVRVPRLPDVAEIEKAPAADKVFADNAAQAFDPAPAINLPEVKEVVEKVDCDDCNGDGKEHECPDCDCSCESCDGSGYVEKERLVSVGIRGAVYQRKYVALIADLPGLQFGPITKEDPLHFRFDGGEGLLMPMREKAGKHFDILD